MPDGTPAPTTKAELLQRLRDERLTWDNLIATVPDAVAIQPNLPNDWSVKDLVAHIASYEQWTAAQIRAANEGRTPTDMELYGRDAVPVEAREWNVDQINAAIYEQHKDLSMEEAQAFAGRAFNDLITALEAVPEEEFLRPRAQQWVREENLLAAIPRQTYDHYAMHADDLRSVAGRMA